MSQFSQWILPLFIVISSLFLLLRKSGGTDTFVAGAKTGLSTAVNLLPTLLLLMTAIGMFLSSGLAGFLSGLLQKLLFFLPIPEELYTSLFIRPFSGSAGTALLSETYQSAGTDSPAGRILSVMAGSSDTFVYITAVYFSAVGVKKSRYTLPVTLVVYLFTSLLSILTVRWWLS